MTRVPKVLLVLHTTLYISAALLVEAATVPLLYLMVRGSCADPTAGGGPTLTLLFYKSFSQQKNRLCCLAFTLSLKTFSFFFAKYNVSLNTTPIRSHCPKIVVRAERKIQTE